MVRSCYPHQIILVCSTLLLFYTRILASQAIVTHPAYANILSDLTEGVCTHKCLLENTTHSHDCNLTHQDLEILAQAIVWFTVGEPFEESVAEQINHSNLLKINLAEHMEENIPGDTHYWLSPQRILRQTFVMVEALERVFPEKIEQISKNFEKISEKIAAIQFFLEQSSQYLQGKTIMTTHGVLGYFCQDFSLKQIALDCHGQEPSLKHINACLSYPVDTPPLLVVLVAGHYEEMGQALAEQLQLPTLLLNPASAKIFEELQKLGEALEKLSQSNELEQKNND